MKNAAIIIVVFAAIAAAFYLGKNGLTVSLNGVKPTASPVATNSPSVAPQATLSPSPVDETSSVVAAVKAGLVAEHGPDAATMNITVSKVEGDYAKGMANAQGGGGIWFAAKVPEGWKLVWDGNGIIFCSDLSDYPNFPNSLIPQCMDKTSGSLITR